MSIARMVRLFTATFWPPESGGIVRLFAARSSSVGFMVLRVVRLRSVRVVHRKHC